VVHPRKNSQTYLQNIEVTLETFWKISMSSCHEVPNELSDLLAQVATCSTQTVNQNTNVVAEVCKVPIKRTSGLTVTEPAVKNNMTGFCSIFAKCMLLLCYNLLTFIYLFIYLLIN